MTLDEYARMIQDVRIAEQIAQGPDYSQSEGEKRQMVFRRSVFAVEDIREGEQFTSRNIRVIRPGYGILPKYVGDLMGRKSKRFIPRGEPILWEDLR